MDSELIVLILLSLVYIGSIYIFLKWVSYRSRKTNEFEEWFSGGGRTVGRNKSRSLSTKSDPSPNRLCAILRKTYL